MTKEGRTLQRKLCVTSNGKGGKCTERGGEWRIKRAHKTSRLQGTGKKEEKEDEKKERETVMGLDTRERY